MMCEHKMKLSNVIGLIKEAWQTDYTVEQRFEMINLIESTEQQLAAAKAELAAMHKDNERQKRLATISRLCKNVQSCRAEKAEQRAEQAEAQCAAMRTAINRYVLGNIGLLDALKAALEEKP